MEIESMTPQHFGSVQEMLQDLHGLWNPTGDCFWSRFKHVERDLKMLEMYCVCLETWKNSGIIHQQTLTSSSIIASLKLIWPKDLYSIVQISLKDRGAYGDIKELIQDLKAKILQSKQLVEDWCLNMMMIHSSTTSTMMMMQFKSLGFQQISELVHEFWDNLPFDDDDDLIVPLDELIVSLAIKLVFLQERTLKRVNTGCPDGEESLRFMNFAAYYAYSLACSTCLYWGLADDNDRETSSILRFDRFHFDMFHKFIPYACDITPFCIDVLKSGDLHLASDPFLLGEAVDSGVGFFFDHLAIVLKDVYPFLRGRLMFLFTFLAASPPPYEHAEDEDKGDSIRDQICAVLREDVYLLLSFDEINKDFSDKKTLFNAFMMRIHTAYDNIRQLYRGGSSDTWISLEVEKMDNYFVSLHIELCLLDMDTFKDGIGMDTFDVEQLQLHKMELRFLRMFLLWLATWDDSTNDEIKVELSSLITTFQGIWAQKEVEEGLLVNRLFAKRITLFETRIQSRIKYWRSFRNELQGKYRQSMLEIQALSCVDLFHLRIGYKTLTSYNILNFMDTILDNLNDLVGNGASKFIPFMNQIETLEGKLIFLKNLLKLAVNCKSCQELGEFKIFVQAFAHDAACLTTLYWTQQGANAISADSDETNYMVSRMLRKIKPTTPNVARLYFGILMSICAHRSCSHNFGQTAFSFVQLFLEDLVTHLEDDDFQILQDNIVFLLTFLHHPPNNQSGVEWICSQNIDVLFWEGLYGVLPFDDDIEGGFSRKKVFLSDFMMKIKAINADAMRRCRFPDSSVYRFPKVISPQFLDNLLKKLKSLKDRMNNDRKYVPFVKYKIIKIEEQLASLGPFFVHILYHQNEKWLEVVNVLHLTEYVIMSSTGSLFVFDQPFWYHMAYLSKVFDELQAVKEKLETIRNNGSCLPSSVGFVSEVVEQGQPSEINEIVVGFEDELEKIVGMLTCGSRAGPEI